MDLWKKIGPADEIKMMNRKPLKSYIMFNEIVLLNWRLWNKDKQCWDYRYQMLLIDYNAISAR